METKKILLTIFALVILIGGGFFAFQKIKNKQTPEQNFFADKFTQDMQKAKNQTRVGTVEKIDEQSLEIRLNDLYTIVKLDKDTNYLIKSKDQKDIKAKLADVKLQDAVSVEYDKITMRALSVTLIKL